MEQISLKLDDEKEYFELSSEVSQDEITKNISKMFDYQFLGTVKEKGVKLCG